MKRQVRLKLLIGAIGELQDILFKNLDSQEQTIGEITQVFKKHFDEYFN